MNTLSDIVKSFLHNPFFLHPILCTSHSLNWNLPVVSVTYSLYVLVQIIW